MKNILVIDDDLHIGNVLEETLTNEGYGVIRAYSGTEAVLLLSQVKPDLVLLDLMLPGLSGEEVLPHIKGIPVIIMSAKVDVDNKVALLLGGAVDYMTKPFYTRELLARIAVHLRTFDSFAKSEILTFEEIKLNIDTHIAQIKDVEIKLTRTEYAILKLLMQKPILVWHTSREPLTKKTSPIKMLKRKNLFINGTQCTKSSVRQTLSSHVWMK